MKKCIFCKEDTTACSSVEHIIPESLGNKEHILRKGIVCDGCNNYFAVKIEKPLLDLPYFRSTRFRNDIESKKGRPTLDKGIMGGEVSIGKQDGGFFISTDNDCVIKGIQSGHINRMIVPFNSEPGENDIHVSRFLCKAALETLIYRGGSMDEWITEVKDHPGLDSIRQYARWGSKPAFWQYHQRRIYNEGDMFMNEAVSKEPYEILHEFNFMYSDEGELFFILVIMGIEYVVSLAAEDISGYRNWLLLNPGKIPLETTEERKLHQPGRNTVPWLNSKLSFYSSKG